MDGWLEWLNFKNKSESDREDAQEVVRILIAKNITSITFQTPES